VKWLPSEGSKQTTADGKYAVVEAVTEHFIAYQLGPTTGEDLGWAATAEDAREICEDRERYLNSVRRAG
jgi:hypothetical protein